MIEIGELEGTLLDLLLEQKEKQNEWWQKIQTATEETLAVIHGWKIDYCLIAPITGQVVFTNYWHENQFVEYGEELCAIVPEMKKTVDRGSTITGGAFRKSKSWSVCDRSFCKLSE